MENTHQNASMLATINMARPCPHLILLHNWNSFSKKVRNSFGYQHIEIKLSPYTCDKKYYKLKVKGIQLHNTTFTESLEFNFLRRNNIL
jgi:hypothetical protein